MKKQPVHVTITYAHGRPSCNPDPVRINWKEGPDSVAWNFAGTGPEVQFATIEFEGEGCLRAIGSSKGGAILGTANTGRGGTYKYTVALYDADGEEVARLDPEIVNDPYNGD